MDILLPILYDTHLNIPCHIEIRIWGYGGASGPQSPHFWLGPLFWGRHSDQGRKAHLQEEGQLERKTRRTWTSGCVHSLREWVWAGGEAWAFGQKQTGRDTCTLVLPPLRWRIGAVVLRTRGKFQLPWTNENDSCCQAGYFKAIYTRELNLILNNITLLNKTPQGYSIQELFLFKNQLVCSLTFVFYWNESCSVGYNSLHPYGL